ncbi:hypothetical protein GQ457_17G018750 [Hibiscus cannabinus]
MSTSSMNKTSIWHARLGHASLRVLHKTPFLQNISLNSDCVQSCSVCPLAKQSRLPFSLSTTSTSKPFELVHLDLWGPYRVSTHSGHMFFLTIVDDFTRMTWVYLLKLKSDTVIHLKTFCTYVHTQYSAIVKTVRSDNGTEFFNSACSDFFKSHGIVHQSSCVSTPQQNGVAERKHRHLLEIARALRFNSHVPVKFWGECVTTACYIINRLPSSVLNWKSPFEVFHNKPPNLSHMKVFGCLCYATQVHNLDKFSPRAIPSVFMGYSSTKKGYVLFNIADKKFFVSRDVIFHETVFPFTFPLNSSSVFFPAPSQSSFSDFLLLDTSPSQSSSSLQPSSLPSTSSLSIPTPSTSILPSNSVSPTNSVSPSTPLLSPSVSTENIPDPPIVGESLVSAESVLESSPVVVQRKKMNIINSRTMYPENLAISKEKAKETTINVEVKEAISKVKAKEATTNVEEKEVM